MSKDIIHFHVFVQNAVLFLSENSLRLQAKHTQFGPIDSDSPCLRTPVPAPIWGIKAKHSTNHLRELRQNIKVLKTPHVWGLAPDRGRCFKQKTGRWLMCRNIIFVLRYHCHQISDIINLNVFKSTVYSMKNDSQKRNCYALFISWIFSLDFDPFIYFRGHFIHRYKLTFEFFFTNFAFPSPWSGGTALPRTQSAYQKPSLSVSACASLSHHLRLWQILAQETQAASRGPAR
jgi:hypothetical protein